MKEEEVKKKEKKENIEWLAKFLLTWAVASFVSLFVVAMAYKYCDIFWTTVAISAAVGLLATVIILRAYDGLRSRQGGQKWK